MRIKGGELGKPRGGGPRLLHNNGASVVYFFIFDARQYFPQTRDAALGLEKHDIAKKSATSDGCAPTHREGAGVWVVAENGRPRKWYAVG